VLELRHYFAQKSVKVTLSLLLIVGGVAYAFVDTFTYLPYIFILSGLIAISLPRSFKFLFYRKLNNRSFYIILFLLYFVPFSMQHENYKRYTINITLPANQTKTYFIVSNTFLKQTDFVLTWFHSPDIKVDLSERSIVNLHRGLPGNLDLDYEYIYKKGYSGSTINGKNGEYEYIVLTPLITKIPEQDKKKLDINDYNRLFIDDSELNRDTR